VLRHVQCRCELPLEHQHANSGHLLDIDLLHVFRLGNHVPTQHGIDGAEYGRVVCVRQNLIQLRAKRICSILTIDTFSSVLQADVASRQRNGNLCTKGVPSTPTGACNSEALVQNSCPTTFQCIFVDLYRLYVQVSNVPLRVAYRSTLSCEFCTGIHPGS
jgi:hypothetical protein